jgi:hypothetical protein
MIERAGGLTMGINGCHEDDTSELRNHQLQGGTGCQRYASVCSVGIVD